MHQVDSMCPPPPARGGFTQTCISLSASKQPATRYVPMLQYVYALQQAKGC
jgi:hypothetical protein